MRPNAIILFSALTLLPGCASTALDAKKPAELASPAAQPPAGLERPCAAPVRLAGKALSAGAVERHWGKDRISLADCKARHGALVAWRRARDAGLAGAQLPDAPQEPDEPTPAAVEPIFRNPLAALFGGSAEAGN
jgi:hypothetical protein